MASVTLFEETDKHGAVISAEWRKGDDAPGCYCVAIDGFALRFHDHAVKAIKAAKRKLASRNKEG